jgi:hypothetical protein
MFVEINDEQRRGYFWRSFAVQGRTPIHVGLSSAVIALSL